MKQKLSGYTIIHQPKCFGHFLELLSLTFITFSSVNLTVPGQGMEIPRVFRAVLIQELPQRCVVWAHAGLIFGTPKIERTYKGCDDDDDDDVVIMLL